MTPIRSSSPWTLAYAILFAGCAQTEAARFPSTDAWPDAKRQADGVAVDPLSVSAAASREGRTDTGSPVVLSPPLATSLAHKTVTAFFEAVSREDMQAVSALMTDRAVWTSPAFQPRGGAPALGVWAARFQKLDYRELANVPIVREAELEMYAEDELEPPAGAALVPGKTLAPGSVSAPPRPARAARPGVPPRAWVAGRPQRPPEMAPTDVLIRAHIVTPRVGADRLLGDEVVFVLRPTSGRYRIALLIEDFQIPLRAMAQLGINPHQCVKCGAPVGTGGGRCPFCGTEQPQNTVGADRSQIATVGLTDANRARMGRPSIRVAPPKKSNAGMVALFVALGLTMAGVTVGGILVLRSPPAALPSASAAPVQARVEPQIVGGVVLTDPGHVDATDVLPRVRKRVTAWDADAKLLEITVTHAKGGGWVNVNEAGSEVVVKYLSEKRDPRAPKGKEITRERLVFGLRPGAVEPETVPGVATDKGVSEPNCVWQAAYRAALKSGLPDGTVDARYGWVAKSEAAVWTITSGGQTRDLDGNSCAIRGH